jgi:phosphopentomutase
MNAGINRVIIIVLDAVGIGELPDAAKFGDVGSNTLVNLARAIGGLRLPNLEKLGIGKITPIDGMCPCTHAIGNYGKMAEKSGGKDTTNGHWEIAGVITPEPFPTYLNGFPEEVLIPFTEQTGRG